MAEQQSGGAAGLGNRQRLEDDYERIAEPEVKKFLTDVQQAALVGAVSMLTVMSLWRSTMDRISQRSSSGALVDLLSTSTLPDAAYSAVTGALAAAAGDKLTARERALAVSEALGLRVTPEDVHEAAYGRLLTPDGNVSWSGTVDALSRTSATADYGSEMIEMGRAEGYTHKRWMTRFDQQVRDTHSAADRQTVPLEDEFLVGGVSLRYPGDPMCADFSEVVGCRCVIVLVNFGDRPLDYPEGEEPWNAPKPS